MSSLSDAPVLPKDLKPSNRSNHEQTMRAIACQLGEAYGQGQLNGYEDVDMSFMALLIESNLSLDSAKECFKLIFRKSYDQSRSVTMYNRTFGRLNEGYRIRGSGSFLQKIKELQLSKVENLVGSLNYFAGQQFFREKKFVPKLLADALASEYSFIYSAGKVFVYQDGAYKPVGEDFIRKDCRIRLGNESTSHRVEEVIHHIIDLNGVEPEQLNRKGRDLLNLKNGMLNWRTGELLPHSATYLSTFQLPIEYNTKAKCPEIKKFFKSTLPKDCVRLIEEIIGYCLIPDVPFQKAFMFVGNGANGKSTFLNLLTQFLGKEHISAVSLQDLSEDKFKRAELFGSLANIFADLGNRALPDTDMFKAIVTGDMITAEKKFKDPFTFCPFAKLLFASNVFPQTNDKTDAYFRRWLIIPFPNSFPERTADRMLLSKLTTAFELSGLLNMALTGVRRLYNNNAFSENISARRAISDYVIENDSIQAFMSDSCEFRNDFSISRRELFDAYTRYCSVEDKKTEGRKTFLGRIRSLDCVNESRTRDERKFSGIRIRNIKGKADVF
jgi:putative DNA primase/helicase